MNDVLGRYEMFTAGNTGVTGADPEWEPDWTFQKKEAD